MFKQARGGINLDDLFYFGKMTDSLKGFCQYENGGENNRLLPYLGKFSRGYIVEHSAIFVGNSEGK